MKSQEKYRGNSRDLGYGDGNLLDNERECRSHRRSMKKIKSVCKNGLVHDALSDPGMDKDRANSAGTFCLVF